MVGRDILLGACDRGRVIVELLWGRVEWCRSTRCGDRVTVCLRRADCSAGQIVVLLKGARGAMCPALGFEGDWR